MNAISAAYARKSQKVRVMGKDHKICEKGTKHPLPGASKRRSISFMTQDIPTIPRKQARYKAMTGAGPIPATYTNAPAGAQTY